MNQLVNQMLLGTVAFTVSVGVGLFVNPNKALVNGVVTVVASYAGVTVADRRRLEAEKQRKNALLNQIQEFEEEESLLYESLMQGRETQHQLEASINALQTERSQLLSRVSELHNQRNSLYQEIREVQQHKQEHLEEVSILRSQIQQLEKHQSELNQSLWAKTAQIQPAETRLNHLHTELEQLQTEIADKLHHHEHLSQDLVELERRKQDLGGEAYDLHTQIQALKQRLEQLNQTFLSLRIQQQRVQDDLNPLKSELEQMQQQLAEKQQQQKQLNQDLVRLEQLKQQLESDYTDLQQQMQTLRVQKVTRPETVLPRPERDLSIILPQKWQNLWEFAQQLSEDELIAFQAILAEDNVALNHVYNQNEITPQELIQSLNDKSMSVLGTALFLSDSHSIIPQLHQDYRTVLKEPISIYFKTLLGLNYYHVQSDLVSTSFIQIKS
ncbi:MAG: hypothetical protein RIE73_23330 [Coleofasciculus sp. C1-SOL-03]|uniref:hypothetical protein n=1 Tax=Coleofasciculus sp. C1-SOL-03 TaxID=3069522 RepID=UPI0032F5E7E4